MRGRAALSLDPRARGFAVKVFRIEQEAVAGYFGLNSR
jgi:hypothetical protein